MLLYDKVLPNQIHPLFKDVSKPQEVRGTWKD